MHMTAGHDAHHTGHRAAWLSDNMYTIACEDRDHPEWHLGTRHAAVWAFEVEWDPAPARRVLGGLLPGYRRQPHITLAYGGLLGTEFDAASHERDVKSLTDLMTPSWPLTIRATGWGTFTTTPYLAVADPQGWMQQAHEELCRNDPRRCLDHYVPHITLGHHAVRRRLTEVTERLGTLPHDERWRCESVSLLRYETCTIAGPLTRIGHVDAAGWHDGPAFRLDESPTKNRDTT